MRNYSIYTAGFAVTLSLTATLLSATEISSTSPRYQAALEAAAEEGAAVRASERRTAISEAGNGRIRVKYRDASEAARSSARETVSAALEDAGIASVDEIQPGTNGTETLVLDRLLGPEALERVARDLAENAAIEWAVPERIDFKQQVNDPAFADQWHYQETDFGVRAAPAWDSATGQGQVVAVLDTGIVEHEDIADNVLDGFDFVTAQFRANDGDGRDPDASDPGDWCPFDDVPISSWHGLHVSGTIAAITDNAVGVAGVARDARILPVRVLGTCGGSSFDITDGIRWAAGLSVPGVPDNPNPAKVINLSLGGEGPCDADYADAIASARQRGATVVVAAGNSDADASGFRPANCEGVVTVAATDRNGSRAFFGRPGRGSNFGADVDVAAPGGETFANSADGVLSTLNSGIRDPEDDAYEAYQGTSMAAPHVSAVAALIYHVHPKATPDEVEDILRTSSQAFPTAIDRPCTTFDCGAGIVDAEAAVAEAMNRAGYDGGFQAEDGLAFVGVASQVPQPEDLNYDVSDTTATAEATDDAERKSMLVLADGRMYEQASPTAPEEDLLTTLQEIVTEAEAAAMAADAANGVTQEGASDVEPQQVIGTDSRFRVGNSALDNFPFRAIGRIGRCTGALIGPRHVLTAAHCLHNDDGTWWWPLSFEPGVDGNDAVNGPGRRAVARRAYTGYSGNRSWDIGLLILEDEPQTARLGRLGFWYYNNTGTYDDRTVFNFGYPLRNLQCPEQTCDGRMWGMSCRISSANSGQFRHGCDTQSGHSGSPVYEIVNGSRRILGVHWGFPNSSTNAAARIRPSVASDLCRWMSWWPSTVGTMPSCAR